MIRESLIRECSTGTFVQWTKLHLKCFKKLLSRDSSLNGTFGAVNYYVSIAHGTTMTVSVTWMTFRIQTYIFDIVTNKRKSKKKKQ